jgi:hypothetical protein
LPGEAEEDDLTSGSISFFEFQTDFEKQEPSALV